MEGTPPPPAEGTPPAPEQGTPPPPEPGAAPTPPEREKASGGLRALGVIGFLVLAFASAVLITAIVQIGHTPTCADVNAGNAQPYQGHCFDGSSTKKTITQVLVWPGGVLAGVAALLALAFAITGRNGRRLVWVLALAIVLSGLGLLIGSI